jgi:ABC-type glycerol-3-phosphate transport system permease component
MKALRALAITVGFLAAALPLFWMGISSLKHRDATISQHPKIFPTLFAPASETTPFFETTTEAYRGLNEVHAGAQHTFEGRADLREDQRHVVGVDHTQVAVHGLGGDSFSTWCHNATGNIWLRDFLPRSEYGKDARIMTFGYDARAFIHPFSQTPMGRTFTFAEALLNDLSDSRRTKAVGANNPCHMIRPLI